MAPLKSLHGDDIAGKNHSGAAGWELCMIVSRIVKLHFNIVSALRFYMIHLHDSDTHFSHNSPSISQFLTQIPKCCCREKPARRACSTALPTLAGALAATGLPCNSEQQSRLALRPPPPPPLRPRRRRRSAFGFGGSTSLSLLGVPCVVLVVVVVVVHGAVIILPLRSPSLHVHWVIWPHSCYCYTFYSRCLSGREGVWSFYAIIILSTFPDPNRCAPGFPLSHPTPVPHPKRSPISRDHVPRTHAAFLAADGDLEK